MDKTENDLIFIERDKPLSEEEIQKKLDILKKALATGHNSAVKEALKKGAERTAPGKEREEKTWDSFQS